MQVLNYLMFGQTSTEVKIEKSRTSIIDCLSYWLSLFLWKTHADKFSELKVNGRLRIDFASSQI